ncbi:MAG: LLM class flavin-dependent oxidoreductase [Chloroflexota bacterium]
MRPDGLSILFLGEVPGTEFADRAVLAEEVGLGAVWLSEEPFFRTALPVAALCAARTRRIRIGVGVVNPFDRPPVWLAMDIATLNEIANGRLLVGVGACWGPPIEQQGMVWERPLGSVRDTIAILRSLLRGEVCHYEGQRFAARGVRLDIDPLLGCPPIYTASMFPRSLQQSGEIADGVVISVLCPAPYVRGARELMAEGAARTERPGAEVSVSQYLPTSVANDGASARDSIKPMLAFLLEHSFAPNPAHWEFVAQLGKFDLGEWHWILGRLQGGLSPTAAVPDDFVRRFALAGTVQECAETLAAYRHAGTTEVVSLLPRGVDVCTQIRALGQLQHLWSDL